jgi:hypothetical protein
MRLVIVGPAGVDANEVVHPPAGLDLVRVRDGRRYPLTDPVTTLGASLATSVVVAGAGAALVAAGVVRRAEGW